MRHLDLFAGILGFSLAFERAGFETTAVSEIDPFCCRLIEHRRPELTNLGDIARIGREHIGQVDIISGGFPCQDLSVAGKRAGLAGSRSGLFWEIARLTGEIQPGWILLENVPGLLSSNKGRDFGIVLSALGELGYGVSWRVLDAQNFGVPQRRRRVFVVGRLGAPCPPEILFEPEGVPGDSEEGRTQGQELAGTLGDGSGARGWASDTDRMTFVPIASACLAGNQRWDAESETFVTHALTAEGHDASEDGTGRGTPLIVNSRQVPITSEVAQPLDQNGYGNAVAFALRGSEEGARVKVSGDATSAIRGASGGSSKDYVSAPPTMAVRRLTPLECERLQGFPDSWTDIPDASDSARYRALGNAVAVPVARWIAQRLVAVAANESLEATA